MMERLDNHLAGLPLCQECQELSGILEILPKSQENVRKIHEFLVMPGMSGIFYEIFHILYFSVQFEKRFEGKIKVQNILHTFIIHISQCGIGVTY